MKIISFSWTAPALLADAKNVRRGAAIKLLKLAHRRRNPLLEVDEYISRREGKFSYDNE